jgi:choline dehydrogenase-like flavoprotein
LLSQSEQYPDGLANSSGTVGRYLMEHAFAGTRALLLERTEQHEIGFITSETHQFYDHDEPSPGSVKLEFFNYAGPSPLDVGLGDGRWGDALHDAMDLEFGNRLQIGALVEQLPDPTNRVTLDPDETDDHGNPVPDVSWSVGDHAIAALEHAHSVQRRILGTMDTQITGQSDVYDPGAARHPAGTTRMGTDPAESVVDARLRTHDLDNLTVASSSVFPTSGAMNPTLTIAALTLKAVEHVDADL